MFVHIYIYLFIYLYVRMYIHVNNKFMCVYIYIEVGCSRCCAGCLNLHRSAAESWEKSKDNMVPLSQLKQINIKVSSHVSVPQDHF